MNTTEKQPVAEQPSEDKSLDVSDNTATESPATSTNNAENNILNKKVDIDYLGSSLFSDVKEISPEDLNQNLETEEVSPDNERYLSTFSDISEREIISGRVIGINEKEVLIDVNIFSKGFEYYRVGSIDISPNNKIMAYAFDTLSRRLYTIKFINLETGEEIGKSISNTSGGLSWANDNETVFYET